jgi:hypothetical protein
MYYPLLLMLASCSVTLARAGTVCLEYATKTDYFMNIEDYAKL